MSGFARESGKVSMYIENVTQSASILYRWYELQEADISHHDRPLFRLLACCNGPYYVHVHVNKGKHLRVHCSFVCDAEQHVEIGVGVVRVCLGCIYVSECSARISASSGYVPPDDFGCSEGCDFAHSAFACRMSDSLCSHSFFSCVILSRAVNESWWYTP
jgi:hypothetical protein